MASLTATTGAWSPDISGRISALRANVAQGNTISVSHIDALQELITELWGHQHTVVDFISRLEYGDGRNTQVAGTATSLAWGFSAAGLYSANTGDVTVANYTGYAGLNAPDISTFGSTIMVMGIPALFDTNYVRTLTSVNRIDLTGALVLYYQVNRGGGGWGDTPDSGENLLLQYSTNGSTWVTLDTTTPASISSNVWTNKNVTLPEGAKLAGGVFLRYFMTGSKSGTPRDTWAATPILVATLAGNLSPTHLYRPAPANGVYTSFLNSYGIWEGNGNYFWVASFPATEQYTFFGAIDNYGTMYLDGQAILNIPNFRSSHNVIRTVTAGFHVIRIYGINTGGPASIGAFIRRQSNSDIIWTTRNRVDPFNTGLLVPTANASGTSSQTITTGNVLIGGVQSGQTLTLEYAVPGTYTLGIPAGSTVEALVVGGGGGGGGGDNRRTTLATGGGGGGGGFYGIGSGNGTRPLDIASTTVTRNLQFGIWYDALVQGFNAPDWSENMVAYAVWPSVVVLPSSSYESYRMFQAPYTGVYYIAGAADQTMAVTINNGVYSTENGAIRTRTASGLIFTAVTMNAGPNVIQFETSNGAEDAYAGFFLLIYDSRGRNGRPGTGNGTNVRDVIIWQPKNFLVPNFGDGSVEGWRVVTSAAWSSFMNTYAVWPSVNINEVKTYNFKRTILFPYTDNFIFEYGADNKMHVDIWDTGQWRGHIISTSNSFNQRTVPFVRRTIPAGRRTLNFTVRNTGAIGGFAFVIKNSRGEIIWDTRTQGVLPETVETDTIYTGDTLTIQVGASGIGGSERGSGSDGAASFIRVLSNNRYYYGFGGRGGSPGGVPGLGGRAPAEVAVGQITYAGTEIRYEIGEPGSGGIGGGTGGGVGATSSAAALPGTAATGAGGGGGWTSSGRTAGGAGGSGGIFVEQFTGDLYGPGGGGGGAGADGSQLGMVASYITAAQVGSTFTWFDTVGISRNATITNGVAATIPGLGIRGVRFAGTSASIAQVPDSPDLRINNVRNANFTVEAWVYRQGTGSNATYGGMIVNKDLEYELAIKTNGQVVFAWTWSNGSWYWIDDFGSIGVRYTMPLPVIPLNTAAHITWVMEGPNARLYIDGVFRWTNSVALARGVYTGRRYPLWIGGRTGRNQQFNGIIANVKLWNVARTAQQILESVRGAGIAGASVYFDGTEDTALIPDAASADDFDFGDQNFSVEFSMRRDRVQPKGAYSGIINKRDVDGRYAAFWIGLTNGRISAYVTFNNSTWNVNFGDPGSAATITFDRWYHVAFTRNANIFRLFLDGAVVASTTAVGTIPNNTFDLIIGTSARRGAFPFVGYLSNLRIVKGSGVYTSAFAVPARPLESTGTNTRLLTFQDTNIVDNSRTTAAAKKTLTLIGNPSVVALSPLTNGFSGASAYFDGLGDYFTIADNAALNYGTGNFTVEVWINTVYRPGAGDFDSIISKYSLSTGKWWGIQINNLGRVVAGTNPTVPNYMIGTNTDVTDGAWHHIALVRSGAGAAAAQTVFAVPLNAPNSLKYYCTVHGNGMGNTITVTAGAVQTFVVTTVPNPAAAGAIYQIDGQNRLVLTLVRGGVYTFDQSSATNTNHPIAFRDSADNSWTAGVVSTGTPGQAGAQTVFTVPTNAPASLKYYCTVHGNDMGNTITVTGIAQTFVVTTVANPGTPPPNNIYQIDGVNRPVLTLVRGGVYTFVQSAATNTNHPIAFRDSADVSWTDGVFSSGTPGVMTVAAGDLKLFVDGLLEASLTNSTDADSTAVVEIGRLGALGTGRFFNGYMSNLRITKGRALYSSNFVVSSVPLAVTTGTSLLTFQDATVQDVGPLSLTLIAVGDARTRAFSPFDNVYNIPSLYFDGSGDYISPSNSATSEWKFLHDGSQDWTIESFFFTSDGSSVTSGTEPIFYTAGMSSSHTGMYFALNPSTGIPSGSRNTSAALYFFNGISGAYRVHYIPSNSWAVNRWNHIVATFDSATRAVRMWINGRDMSVTTTSYGGFDNSSFSAANPTYRLYIGDGYFGYLSNIRVIKGERAYTDTLFTTPNEPLTAVSGTWILTGMDTFLNDRSSRNWTITATGNTRIEDFSPFGIQTNFSGTEISYSAFFDGTGDFVRIGTVAASPTGVNAPLVLDGDFTIEMWLYQPTIPTTATPRVIFELGNRTSGDGLIVYSNNTNGQTVFVNGVLRASNLADRFFANSWQHLVLAKEGTTLRIFVDAQLVSTIAEVGAINTAGGRLHIGDAVHTSGVNYFGFISNFRIVKGNAVYLDANYIIPLDPLSRLDGTSLLIFQDVNFIDNSVHAFTGNASNFAITGDTFISSTSPFVSSGGAPGGNGGLFGGGGGGGATSGTGLGAQGAVIINYQASGLNRTVVLANVEQTSYTIPADFLYFNFVAAIGAGGSGGTAVSAVTAFGGGGGGFSRSTTIAGVSAGSIVYLRAGRGGRGTGASTWFNTIANSAPVVATTGVLALGGQAGTISGAGLGGSTTGAIGNTRFAGGAGGGSAYRRGFGGGGGAGGPLGAGARGGFSTDVSSPGNAAAGGGGGAANQGGIGANGTSDSGGRGGGNAVAGAFGGSGGPTVVYYQGFTLYAAGGNGGQYNNNSLANGGGAAGGDTNIGGGYGHGTGGDDGGGGGGGIGTGNAVHDGGNAGDNGANSNNVSRLFEVVSGLGQVTVLTGGVGSSSGKRNSNNRGGAARGFGGGGGGAGYWGGDGGRGLSGGGGGGAAGYGANYQGGTGGGGVVVVQNIGADSANAAVILTSGNSYIVPTGTTSVKIWSIGGGGGGAGATTNDNTAGGGGGAGGVSEKTFVGGPTAQILNITSANGVTGGTTGFGGDSVYPDQSDTRGRPGSLAAQDGIAGLYGGGGAGGFATLNSGIQEPGTGGGDGYVKLIISNYAAPGTAMPNIATRHSFFSSDANIVIRAAHVNNMYQNLVRWAGSTHLHDISDQYGDGAGGGGGVGGVGGAGGGGLGY